MAAKQEEGWNILMNHYLDPLPYMYARDWPRIKFVPEVIAFVNQQHTELPERRFRRFCLRVALFCQELYDEKIEASSEYPYTEGSEGFKTISLAAFEKLLDDAYD